MSPDVGAGDARLGQIDSPEVGDARDTGGIYPLLMWHVCGSGNGAD